MRAYLFAAIGLIVMMNPAWANDAGARKGVVKRGPAAALDVGPAALANKRPELLFRPLPPCRLFDTAVNGSKLSKFTRTFKIAGSGDFSTQGGEPTGCGVPDSTSLVVLTLTTSNANRSGVVRTAPFNIRTLDNGVAAYNANSVAVSPATVRISQNSLDVKAQGGQTDIAGDVVGYFVEQISAAINGDGTIFAGSNRLSGVVRQDTGAYDVEFGRDVSACAVNATASSGSTYASAIAIGKTVFVNTWTLDGGQTVPTDIFFYLTAHC